MTAARPASLILPPTLRLTPVAGATTWLLLTALASGANAAIAADPPAGAARAADPDWHIPAPPADAPAPSHPDYALLAATLQRYRAVASAGGWPQLASGSPLALGARDPRVVALRARLQASGDYDSEMGADPWFFDTGIDRALRRVQRRHLLPENGVLDEPTLEAINIPVADLIGRIEVAMERWRWLPRDLGPRVVWVNIPRAQLDVVENGRSRLTMRVVVGHKDRPTPSLAGSLDRVVFNPTWSVPATIAVEDLLPQQQADPGFLQRHGIRVFSDAGGSTREVPASQVNWSRLGRGRFPYRFVQDAGPGNSLGRIKLAFENPYDIYLHDTPAKGLFDLATRTLSSGCVRLENAPALATLLLANDQAWRDEDTAENIHRRKTRALKLQHTTPLYLVYITVWANEAGELRFGRDLYQRDVPVLAALRGQA